jgi:signal transduction histidine kinase
MDSSQDAVLADFLSGTVDSSDHRCAVITSDDLGAVRSAVSRRYENKDEVCFRQIVTAEERIWHPGYFPFLSLLLDFGSVLPPAERDDLIDRLCYSPHRPLFRSLLTGDEFERNDPLFDFELAFERQKFEEGIAGLLCALFESRKLVLHLAGVGQMFPRAVRVLERILLADSGISVIASLSDERSLRVEEPGRFSDLIRRLDLPQTSVMYGHETPGEAAGEPPPLARRLDLLEINTWFLNTSLAIKQAEALTGPDVEGDAPVARLEIPDQVRLFLLAGDNYRLAGRAPQAQTYYRRAYSILQEGREPQRLARCCERLSISYLESGNGEEAERYGKQFHDYDMEVQDWSLLAHAELLRFRLHQFRSEYFRGYVSFFRQRLSILEPLFQRTGMLNAMAYVLSNETMIISMLKANEGIDETISYLNRSLETAGEIGNIHRMALVHHGLGICYQAIKHRREAEHHYREAIEHASTLADSDLANRLSNGVGYFFFTAGDYDTAAQYYHLALQGLTRSREFPELCSSFFNYGSINFFLFRHREAMKYYEFMLKVMNPLGIRNLQYHSREIIYSLIGICAIKIGDINKAYRYFRLAGEEAAAEDVFSTYEYYTFLKAMIALNESRIDESVELLNEVIRIEESKEVDETYLVLRALFELMFIERSRGNSSEERALASRIAQAIPPGHFPFLRTMLTAWTKGGELPEALGVHPLGFDGDLIIELARQEAHMSALSRKMDEMRIINELQTVLQRHGAPLDFSPGELRFLAEAFRICMADSEGEADLGADFTRAEQLLGNDERLKSRYLASLQFQTYQHHQKHQRYAPAKEALKRARQTAMENNNFELLSRVIDSSAKDAPAEGLFAEMNPLRLLCRLASSNPEVRDRWKRYVGNAGSALPEQSLELLVRYYGLITVATQLLVGSHTLEFMAIGEFHGDELLFFDSVYPLSVHTDGYFRSVRRTVEDLAAAYRGGAAPDAAWSESVALELGLGRLFHMWFGSRGEGEPGYGLAIAAGRYDDIGSAADDTSRLLRIAGSQLWTALQKLQGERELVRQNVELEQRVAERTRELQESLLQVEAQRSQILEYSRRLEGRVQQQGQELIESEQMATLGQLVANLSHEISSPLGNVVLLDSTLAAEFDRIAGALEEGDLSREDFDEFLERGRRSLAMADDNVSRVLDLMTSFRKLAFNQAAPELERFNLHDYLQNVFTLFGSRLEKTAIRLEFSCPAGLEIRSYPGVYSQILTNLLLNSMTHAFPMSSRGEQLRGETGEAARIDIAVETQQDRLIIRFADNGAGMEEETRSRIFEAYFTTNRTGGGTGLGLHIIHDLVTGTLGGTISCTSSPGTGTEFIIDVPADTEAAPR